MIPATNNMRGALYALAAFGIFATHDTIVKFLGGFYVSFQIIFFSTLMGFPIVTLMLMRDKTDGNLRPRHPWWTALRTGSMVISGASAFYAFSVLPLAQVYAILFAAPLIITLLAIPILGETVRLRRGLAVVVGLVGVLIVIRPEHSALSLGHLAAMVAAISSALSSIIVRKIGQEERSVVLLFYPMVANFVVMGILLPFVYHPMPILHLGGMASMSVLAFVAMLLVIGAYRNAEAVIVAPMQYSQILWAAVYGYVFFGEKIDRGTALGAAVIIASGLYILFRESRAKVSENRPATQTRSRPDAISAPRIAMFLGRSKT